MEKPTEERAVDAASLPLRGQPLHTRTLVIDVLREDAQTVRAEGQILDLRKCAFVPTGGDLQTAGFIHQMKITTWCHPEERVIQRLETAQPHIAYDPHESTAGECCRDPAPRLQQLVGTRFDRGFAKRLSQAFGGPLGCSHLLTLGQLMGHAIPPGLDRETGIAPGGLAVRQDGERLFKRTLVVDGCADGEDRLEVGVQQAEFHMRPRIEVSSLLERLAHQHEVHVHGRVDLGPLVFTAIDAAERIRTGETLFEEAWSERSAEVSSLVGFSALRGLSGELFRLLGADADRAMLLDALLNVAPGLIQCLAATSGRWMARMAEAMRRGSARPVLAEAGGMASGGFPDSCFMWRSEGPLQKAREAGAGFPGMTRSKAT
ncbi:MAG: hypothetical protein CL910_08370 [Deltaproteobacteria bacterium]|jgi:hypothetical protein|nr:hypothetical protein [Deltaproteobacteria bacterium]